MLLGEKELNMCNRYPTDGMEKLLSVVVLLFSLFSARAAALCSSSHWFCIWSIYYNLPTSCFAVVVLILIVCMRDTACAGGV